MLVMSLYFLSFSHHFSLPICKQTPGLKSLSLTSLSAQESLTWSEGEGGRWCLSVSCQLWRILLYDPSPVLSGLASLPVHTVLTCQ